jgi:hypothetical protein
VGEAATSSGSPSAVPDPARGIIRTTRHRITARGAWAAVRASRAAINGGPYSEAKGPRCLRGEDLVGQLVGCLRKTSRVQGGTTAPWNPRPLTHRLCSPVTPGWASNAIRPQAGLHRPVPAVPWGKGAPIPRPEGLCLARRPRHAWGGEPRSPVQPRPHQSEKNRNRAKATTVTPDPMRMSGAGVVN